MATTKKTETKATPKETVKAIPATEVKTEAAVNVTAPSEPEKKEPAKKEPVKKENVKKETVKKEAAPKAPAKKNAAKEIKSKVFIQYGEIEVSADSLVSAAKKACTKTGIKAADIKTLEVYVKPEEGVAYYVVNGNGSEEHRISL